MGVRQRLLEEEMLDSGIARYRAGVDRAKRKFNKDGKLVDISDESNTSYGISIMKYFVDSIADCIRLDLEKHLGRPGVKPVAWEYLATINPEVSAFISAKTIIDGISKTVKLTSLAVKVASKVEDNCRFEMLKRFDAKYLRSTQRFIKDRKITDYRAKRDILLNSAKRSDAIPEWESWPIKHKIHIGIALIEAFIKATSDYDQDGNRVEGTAFIEKYMNVANNIRTIVLCPTAKAHDWIKANMDVCESMYPDYMPCIEQPLPWTNPTNGGFHTRELRRRKPLVKMQRPEYLKLMHKNVDAMPEFYRTVNLLQSTAWDVNTFVYNQLALEFTRMDGIEMPQPTPYELPPCPLDPILQGNMTDKEFRAYKKYMKSRLTYDEKVAYAQWHMTIKEIKRKEVERASKALQIGRTLGVARKFKDEEEFYYVWTADFRSRLYAVGTAMSPQGTEKAKALCRFRKGVPLGANGLKHLMYHAAGVYGVDKCTLEERIQFVYNNKQAIVTTGLNPENSRDFWKQADHPYQFLAVCEELAECLILGGDCQDFISHIPCAQDGSCNGIQHYSAMLCDPIGAKATNLCDSDIPGDIYMLSADKVIGFLKRCIDKREVFDGKYWRTATIQDMAVANAWMEFGIERACTKKPTMVIPYGGTKIGCRDTCMSYLTETTESRQKYNPEYMHPFADINTVNDKGDPTDPAKYAITYLHHLVWKALDEVVVAARVAMRFIKNVTQAVVKQGKSGSMIKWTTKTGFVVYQDIKNTRQDTIQTHLEGRLRLNFRTELKTIDTRKMQTSIAPNFVHSNDSTHLQMAICLANDFGITDFCTVHDSFAVHAGHCDTLHMAIRESFVMMHKDNLLEEFWIEQYNNASIEAREKFPALADVKRRGFDLNEVLTATHFFR